MTEGFTYGVNTGMIVFVASLIFGLLVTGSVNAPVNRPIPAYQ